MIVNENSDEHKKYFKRTKDYRALVEFNDRSTKWYYFDNENELPQYIQNFMHKS